MSREIKFRAWSSEYKEMYYKDFQDFEMQEVTTTTYKYLL